MIRSVTACALAVVGVGIVLMPSGGQNCARAAKEICGRADMGAGFIALGNFTCPDCRLKEMLPDGDQAPTEAARALALRTMVLARRPNEMMPRSVPIEAA